MQEKIRCDWCKNNQLYITYHDNEWGRAIYDDHLLYELLNLEIMQAGLSWITILKRRENFRAAFDNFDAQKITNYSDKKIATLISNPYIIRNRLKIRAIINNAAAFLKIQEQFGSFKSYIWQFVEGKVKHNNWQTIEQVPATSHSSDQMSEELKRHGFTFVGSTTCYAYMQATGMINDHIEDCFCYQEIRQVEL